MEESIELQAQAFDGGRAGVRLLDDEAEAGGVSVPDVRHRAAARSRGGVGLGSGVVQAGGHLGELLPALLLHGRVLAGSKRCRPDEESEQESSVSASHGHVEGRRRRRVRSMCSVRLLVKYEGRKAREHLIGVMAAQPSIWFP